MTAFTALELAALRSIFSETPELAELLERQLAAAVVVSRENTGAGFFTTIAVAEGEPPACGPGVLGNETFARVAAMEHGLGFVLFLEGGRLHLLDGYALTGSTTTLDLCTAGFEVYREVPSGIERRPSH